MKAPEDVGAPWIVVGADRYMVAMRLIEVSARGNKGSSSRNEGTDRGNDV